MSTATESRRLYWQAARDPAVWRRAARLGLIIGFLQTSLNQGDHWLRGEITAGLVLKTILSPLLSFAVAFLASLGTRVEALRRTSLP
jgi:hypothetical protein